mmetsp:Transcript_9115/g.19680  ORF Transcript_9115/g.19680 Transcript_9115/m.19680 type:complete len:87 (+) Transcript_9115:2791-3051(+)
MCCKPFTQRHWALQWDEWTKRSVNLKPIAHTDTCTSINFTDQGVSVPAHGLITLRLPSFVEITLVPSGKRVTSVLSSFVVFTVPSG